MPQGMHFIPVIRFRVEGLNPVTRRVRPHRPFTDAGPRRSRRRSRKWGFSKVFDQRGDEVRRRTSPRWAPRGGKFNVGLGEAFRSPNLKDTVIAGGHFTGLKGDFDVPAEVAGRLARRRKFDFGNGRHQEHPPAGVFCRTPWAPPFNAAADQSFGPLSTVEARHDEEHDQPARKADIRRVHLDRDERPRLRAPKPHRLNRLKETITRERQGDRRGPFRRRVLAVTLEPRMRPAACSANRRARCSSNGSAIPSNTIEF